MNKPFHPDFVTDPSFRAWALQTDLHAYARWESWLKAHPQHAEEAYTAAELIRSLAEGEAGDTRPEARLPANWARLQTAIANHETNKKPDAGFAPALASPTQRLRSLRTRQWLAAASIVLLLGLGLWFFAPRGGQTMVLVAETDGPETFTLPDHSQVTLNAGSELRYQRAGWFETWDRQVSLSGEGFFDVMTTPERARFHVRADGFEVTVLGTRFNVRNQAGVRDVVLEEGKVRMTLTAGPATEYSLTLQPGQRAVLDTITADLALQSVNVASYTAWRQGLIVLDDLPVAEVLRKIKQAYGWELVLEDTTLARQTMKGTIPANDPEVVRQTFMVLFNLDWQQQGDTVYLREQVRP